MDFWFYFDSVRWVLQMLVVIFLDSLLAANVLSHTATSSSAPSHSEEQGKFRTSKEVGPLCPMNENPMDFLETRLHT